MCHILSRKSIMPDIIEYILKLKPSTDVVCINQLSFQKNFMIPVRREVPYKPQILGLNIYE